MGLRLMSLIAEESENKKGGQIITLIHSFASSNGDPVVAAFAERLLGSFTRPWYGILRHWIYDGELSDPSLEFFVRGAADTAQLGHGAVFVFCLQLGHGVVVLIVQSGREEAVGRAEGRERDVAVVAGMLQGLLVIEVVVVKGGVGGGKV